jgi:hypothetical protein
MPRFKPGLPASPPQDPLAARAYGIVPYRFWHGPVRVAARSAPIPVRGSPCPLPPGAVLLTSAPASLRRPEGRCRVAGPKVGQAFRAYARCAHESSR